MEKRKMGFLGLFRSEESESKKRPEIVVSPLSVIEGKVIAAFTKVRQDITLVSSWLKYLRHKDMIHEQRHARTQRELGEHKVHIEHLKAEAAELKAAHKELREELKQARMMALEAKPALETAKISPLTNRIRTESGLNPDRKRTYFENKVVSMLRSRRKDYILKQILELAAKDTHSTREIEEIVVGEKALCGRTAFYDYLRELKHKRLIRQGEKGAKKIISAIV